VGKPDWDKALKWWRLAAEKRNTDSMCKLGFMYSTGRGVEQDYGEAYFWYLLAVSYGHPIDLKEDAKHLTPKQIEEAQARVKKWQEAYRK
jgi:hypothetical protein